MHAIIHLFPNIEELKVLYQLGYPDDDTLIGLGAEFLSRLPRLTKFHLYNPRIIHSHISEYRKSANLPSHLSQIKLGPCAEPEFTESGSGFLSAWMRYTPLLEEVRLVKDFVWRRDLIAATAATIGEMKGRGNVWYKRYPERLEKEIGAIQKGWEVDPEF
jgi:hypothetical protein